MHVANMRQNTLNPVTPGYPPPPSFLLSPFFQACNILLPTISRNGKAARTRPARPKLVRPPRFTVDDRKRQSQPQTSLRSLLREFLAPLRSDDSRADFYAVYRRESESFDRDYVGKYSQDLDTSLLFAGLFSAVSATFATSIQSSLEPDPNQVTAAYMQLLIHTMNNSLFPDANPDFVTLAPASPPAKVVAAQATLYASLAISLLTAFLATLGKQWVNRYTRNHGGSTAEKSQDRQRKLNALNDWQFHLVIESLPVMLQIALLLFGCAMSIYVGTVNYIVAWVILTFTLIGISLYTFFTITSMLSPSCPYQTPFSIAARALVPVSSSLYRSMRSGKISKILGRLRSGIHVTRGCALGAPGDVENPRPRVVELHSYNFGETVINPEEHVDAHCISWVLDFATDDDVVFRTARFAVEMDLHPEIASVLSPNILADHLLGCALDRRVIPGGLERTNMVGMALASVLSIRLCMDPEGRDLQRLSRDIHRYTDWISTAAPTFLPGVAILGVVSHDPGFVPDKNSKDWKTLSNIPDHLPSMQKLCLSKTALQTVWRWRRNDPVTVFNLEAIGPFCDRLVANGDHVIPALKINCFLIMAISLGAWADDVRKLFTPNTEEALETAISIFSEQFQESIKNPSTDKDTLTSVLSALVYLDPFQALESADHCFEWFTDILESRYPEESRYRMAVQAMRPLEKYFRSEDPNSPLDVQPTWIPSFVHFLSLHEKFHATESSTCPRSLILHILSTGPRSTHLSTAALPILTLALSPTHPLQLRCSALKAFARFASNFSLEKVPDADHRNLLQAVGDPFQSPPTPPLLDDQHVAQTEYDSMMAVATLIEFASSDEWQIHLPTSAFTSCDRFVSTAKGRELALNCLHDTAATWSGFLHTHTKVNAAITHLEGLQCPNVTQVLNTWAQATGLL